MKTQPTILLILPVLLALSSFEIAAKPWRGLIPTKSTKLDADRLHEKCSSETIGCSFTIEDGKVLIIFSGGDIGDGKCSKLKEGTVLAISIKFDHLRKLKDFQLNNKKAVVFDPSSPTGRGYKAYYYPGEGFIISTFKGRVLEVVYIAEQKDIHHCPEYYKDPKGFVAVGLVY